MAANIVTSVIGSLGASSLSNMNAKRSHAHLLRSYHALRENHCYRHTVSSRAVIEFLVKEGNSAGVIYERLYDVYGDAWMGFSSVRRWVKHFKDGNTDIADQLRCGRPRTQAKSRRAHQRRPKDNSQRNCSAAWSGAPCGPGDDGDFGISGSLFPLSSPFAYRYRRTQNGCELLSHPPYSPDLAPSDYHLFGSLKDHLRGHQTTTLTMQSTKPCETGCEELERNSTADSATLAEIHRLGLKFCIKVVKDA
jgi:hypothetical protein